MKSCLLLVFLFMSCGVQASEKWVDDWFDNAVYDKGSSYESQKRGFYTAPSFSARVNSTTEYPVSVTAPKLSIGCGGIDAFGGGLAFLDADYLVEKVQGVMQAAPFIALDMAMKTMCKECSDTLAKAEQIANFLNGIQLNECALAKPMVTTIAGQNPQSLVDSWGEATGVQAAADGITRMWTETKEEVVVNDNNPTVDIKKQIDACPKEFRDLMADGYLMEKVAGKTGLADYADILRGYIGDVKVKASATDKIPTATSIVGCPQNKEYGLDDLLHGKSYAKDDSGVCTQSAQRSISSIVNEKLNTIVNKMNAGTMLTADEERFIFLSPNLPVYTILIQSIVNNTTDEDIRLLTDVIAVHYSYVIYDDMYRNINYALNSAKAAIDKSTNDPTASSSARCNVNLYADVINKFKNLIAKSKDHRKELKSEYIRLLREKNDAAAFVRIFKDRNEEIRNNKALMRVK